METIIKDFKQLENVAVPIGYRPRYTPDENQPTQKQLLSYKRLRYGTRSMSAEEVSVLTPRERKAIIYAQERANEIINEMAQDKLNAYVIRIIKKVIPNICGDSVDILLEPVFIRTFIVDNSIAPLKVSQAEIIEEFKRKGLI